MAYTAPGGAIRVVDAVAGVEYELSRERFVALLAADAPELDRKLPAALRATPARVREFAAAGLRSSVDNASLLSAVELACHRQLNRGGWYPQAEHPAPAFRKRYAEAPAIALPLARGFGPPVDLVDCLARRSSKRTYADAALPLSGLAGLLQLACRTRAVIDQRGEQLSLRAYPSGGGRYSLEVYPIVFRVAGIRAGAYHYDPFDHALSPLATDPQGGAQLLELVRDSMAGQMTGLPSAVLVVTSVFARTSRKYRFNAYHLILEELGGLYQTIYLAAERLGLAACALGQVKERWTGNWLGLTGIDEAQVGLFALGVPAAVQDTVPVDAIELPADPALRCGALGDGAAAPCTAIRLCAGDLAYTVTADELSFDLDGAAAVIAGWDRRRLRFALDPRASAAFLSGLAAAGDHCSYTTAGRWARVRTSERLRRQIRAFSHASREQP